VGDEVRVIEGDCLQIAQHNIAHGSLNRCVKALMEGGGRLTFCRETFTYKVVA
jgi:hypothetical protein